MTGRTVLVVFLATLAMGCGRRVPQPPSTVHIASVTIPVPPPPPPAPEIRKRIDPVAEFRSIVEQVKEKGTTPRTVRVRNMDRTLWERRRFEAIDVVYDVGETDVPGMPYKGEIRWKNVPFVSPARTSKDQAEREPLQKVVAVEDQQWHARFEYRDDQWWLRDVWWTAPGMDRGVWHSKLQGEEEAESLNDWYIRLIHVS